MRGISTLELAVLARELSGMKGFHVDKFYELADGVFRMRLSRKGERADLQCALGITVNATKYIETAEQPTGFALAARKRMSGAIIDSVKQYNDDRILLVRLLKGDSALNIVLEMFGRGNLVVTDDAMTILLAYRVHDFKDRSVRPGATYSAPKNSPITIPGIGGSSSELERLAAEAQQDLSLAAFLSRSVNLGTTYIEDAILKTGIDPKAALGTHLNSLPAVWRRIQEARDAIERPSFVIYEDNGVLVDYSVVPLKKYEGLARKEFPAMQEMLDELYYATTPKEAATENRLAKELSISIGKQKLAVEEMAKSIALNREAGRKIFELLSQINALIEYAREHRRATLEELREQFPGLSITAVDLKAKTVKVSI